MDLQEEKDYFELFRTVQREFFFLESIHATNIPKTIDKIYKMLDEIVEEVDEEKIDQFVMENVVNYKATT